MLGTFCVGEGLEGVSECVCGSAEVWECMCGRG